jgi:hypothetical protein
MTILPAKYARIYWDEEHALKWCGETFTWTGRDSYLAWVTAWKAELHTRIEDIRRLKAQRRNKALSIEARNYANHQRQLLRVECCNLLLLRMMGKKLSSEQRTIRLAA